MIFHFKIPQKQLQIRYDLISCQHLIKSRKKQVQIRRDPI